VAGEDGASHHVTVIRANDYSPNTFEALDTDAREHDQDSWLSEKTCCHWNRCSAPRTPGMFAASVYTYQQKDFCSQPEDGDNEVLGADIDERFLSVSPFCVCMCIRISE
jgi:hypothetical protein